MIAIARDPARFNFVSACAPNLDIVLGDARLTLAREPDGAYDLIVVDAYSSDAIPVSGDARDDGDLQGQARTARRGGHAHHQPPSRIAQGGRRRCRRNALKTWAWTNPDDRSDLENFVARADVVIAAQRSDDIGALASAKTWTPTEPDPSVRTWTDDYSNIAGVLWRRYLQPAPR